MKSINKFSNQIKRTFFFKINIENKNKFEKHIYKINVSRFFAFSIFIAFLDFLTILFYNNYLSGPTKMPIIFKNIVILQIFLMLGVSFYILKQKKIEYDCNFFIKKNFDFIYLLIYVVGEFLIFSQSPKDFISLGRFFIIALIIGGIPILNQNRNFILQSINFMIQIIMIYIFFPKFVELHSPVLLTTSWLIIFISSNLISNIIYSSNANNFILKNNEILTKEQLNVANKKLELLLLKDELSSIDTYKDFITFVNSSYKKAKSFNYNFNIILIDVDLLKNYNDLYGTESGDNCLIKIVRAIRSEFNESDYMFSRFDSNKFSLSSFGKNHEDLVNFSEYLRQVVEDLNIFNESSLISNFVTVSIGVSSSMFDSLEDITTITSICEECLYFAKQNGRNQVIHSIDKNKIFLNLKNEFLIQQQKEINFSNNNYVKKVNNIKPDLNSANFTFAYYKNLNRIEFSEMAVSFYNLPECILSPSLDKVISYFSEDENNFIKNKIIDAIQNNKVYFEIEVIKENSKSELSNLIVKANCLYSEKNLEGIYGSIINIDEVMHYNESIESELFIDKITLLPNRKKFYTDMNNVLNSKEKFGHSILIDINDFKVINSMYNHNNADKVLFQVGKILQELVSFDGNVYNYSIDQFIVVLENSTQDSTQDFMENIQRTFNDKRIIINDINIKIAFSMGAVYYCYDMKVDELLVNLDITVQKSKLKSKNEYAFFEEKDKINYFENANLEKELKESIENNFNGFLLHYQPIVSSIDKKCVGVEALLRYIGKDGVMVSPISTIPILEKSGLMAKVETWIFDEAFWQCKDWIEKGASQDFFIQVNLSTVQMSRSTLIDEVVNASKIRRLEFSNLRLEVTESSVMQDKFAINTLNLLREMGIKIAIDDFGTGYSSLSYLRSLPVDEIKIDKSFLNNIDNDLVAKDFLSAIISMSKSMGYLVCVEGVETNQQKNILENFKTDYFQGFLFSRPLLPDVLFKEFIEEQSDSESFGYKII